MNIFFIDSNIWSKEKVMNSITLKLVMKLLFLFGFFVSNISAQTATTNHTQCANYVRIEGSSNVNKFYFEQTLSKPHPETNTYYQSAEYIEFDLPVEYFKASNPRMRNDFMELIKANDYPIITIFIKLPQEEIRSSSDQEVTSFIKVKLAGQEMKYQLAGKVHTCQNNSIRLQGTLELDINDFNLSPPTKFMGMVKVNKEVFINFGLIIDYNLLTKSN